MEGELIGVSSRVFSAGVTIVAGLNQTDVSSNGTFWLMKNTSEVLECGLDGVDEHNYPVQWTLPPVSKAEQPSGVTVNGTTLEFNAPTQEQEGLYTCSIAGFKATVYIMVTSM